MKTIALVLMTLLMGCQSDIDHTSILSARIGEKNTALIATSKKIGMQQVALDKNREIILLGDPIFLSEQEKKELVQQLLNDRHYYFDRNKKSIFIPEVVFLWEGEDLMIAVSTLSNQLRVIDLKHSTLLDYDPMSAQFNPMIIRLFVKLQGQEE